MSRLALSLTSNSIQKIGICIMEWKPKWNIPGQTGYLWWQNGYEDLIYVPAMPA